MPLSGTTLAMPYIGAEPPLTLDGFSRTYDGEKERRKGRGGACFTCLSSLSLSPLPPSRQRGQRVLPFSPRQAYHDRFHTHLFDSQSKINKQPFNHSGSVSRCEAEMHRWRALGVGG
jgi:hypothetical protein